MTKENPHTCIKQPGSEGTSVRKEVPGKELGYEEEWDISHTETIAFW